MVIKNEKSIMPPTMTKEADENLIECLSKLR